MSGSLDALTSRIDGLIDKRVRAGEPFRATVQGVSSGLVTIRRVESSADDAEQYARVAGFTLQVGDEVLCLPTNGKPVVIGRLQRGTITDLDLTVDDLTITGTQTGGSGGGGIGTLTPDGIVVQNASTPTYVSRSIAGTSNQITVTNGSGVAGDPTIAISRDVSLTGDVVTTYDATTPRPVLRVNTDNSLGSGSLGGFQVYRGANIAAEFKVDAGGTVDFKSYAGAGSFPDFRIFAYRDFKIIPANEAAGEAFRFQVDTSSTGSYGYLTCYQAKDGNTAGARIVQTGGPGLAIDATAGFVKIGAASAVPVTISQSGQTTTIGGALAVNGDTTLGDASGDTVTVNAGTVTFPSAGVVDLPNRGIGNVAFTEDGSASSTTASTTSTTVYSIADTATLTVPTSGTYRVYVVGSLSIAHSTGGLVRIGVKCDGTYSPSLTPEVGTYSTSAAWERAAVSYTFIGVSITTSVSITLEFRSASTGTTYARNPQIWAYAIRTA